MATTEGKGLHVLVVDDHEDARDLLTFFLEKGGHTVETAGTGGAAIRLTSATRYDVVLLDISIPEHDGYEVARAIATRWGADKPLLVSMSGHSTEAISARGQEAGFDVVLPKPVDLARLGQLLTETRDRLASA